MKRASEYLLLHLIPGAFAAVLVTACVLISFSMCAALRATPCAVISPSPCRIFTTKQHLRWLALREYMNASRPG